MADTCSNILVIFATGDPDAEWGSNDVGLDRCTLREGTAYATTVKKVSDVLIWVGRDGRQDLHLEAGLASQVRAALEEGRVFPEKDHDLLSGILRMYRGADRPEVEVLAAKYREGAGGAEPPQAHGAPTSSSGGAD